MGWAFTATIALHASASRDGPHRPIVIDLIYSRVSNDHADRSIDIDRVALTDLDACSARERANARKRWDEEENGNRR